MVVMADRRIINDPGLLPEGIPYIYIDLCDCRSSLYKLVQE